MYIYIYIERERYRYYFYIHTYGALGGRHAGREAHLQHLLRGN